MGSLTPDDAAAVTRYLFGVRGAIAVWTHAIEGFNDALGPGEVVTVALLAAFDEIPRPALADDVHREVTASYREYLSAIVSRRAFGPEAVDVAAAAEQTAAVGAALDRLAGLIGLR